MACPECGTRTDVYDSRLNMQGLVRRRRSCSNCGTRFATIEVMNMYHPLGKREKPDAPIPEPPPQVKAAKPERVKKERVRSPAKKTNAKESDDDRPAWANFMDQDDFDDLGAYLDLPKGMSND